MCAAARACVLAAALAAAACSEQQPASGNNSAAAEVEALPADESVQTSSEELANGVNEPDIGNLDNQH